MYSFFCITNFIIAIDSGRDIETLNEEEIETEFNESEFEESEQQSIAFTPHNTSIPILNPLDSGSEDYRFSAGKNHY